MKTALLALTACFALSALSLASIDTSPPKAENVSTLNLDAPTVVLNYTAPVAFKLNVTLRNEADLFILPTPARIEDAPTFGQPDPNVVPTLYIPTSGEYRALFSGASYYHRLLG